MTTDLDGWNGFGIAVQAYQKRGLFVIEWVRELTQKGGPSNDGSPS